MAELTAIGVVDADHLARLHALAFDRPWNAAEFESLLRTGAEGFMTPDGFILVRAVAGEAEILTLAVSPAARRQGLGRRLVAAIAKAARADALFLEVAIDNAPALGLYEQAGFERAGMRKGYYSRDGGAVDALVLRKSLA